MRPLVALAAGAATAALGANILGEYDFAGLMPLAAGLLFGLAVAEVMVGVGRLRSWPVAGMAAVASGTGVWWAARISTNFGLLPMPAEAWAAVGLAAVTAGWRARPPRSRSPAVGSPPSP